MIEIWKDIPDYEGFTNIGIITMEIKPILEERGSRYGKFKNNAEVSQYLKFTIKSAFNSNNHKIYDYHYEALDNICQKMARIANGDLTMKIIG